MIISCSPTPPWFLWLCSCVFTCESFHFWGCASKILAQPQNLAEVLTLVHDTLVSPVNKETLTNNVHKPISSSAHFFFFLLHWSQICLRYITFPVVCAGLGQACLPAGESWEQERQQVRGRCTFFRGSLLGLQMFAAVREATWTYLIQHYYATETGLAARELAACARWNMWNAWVILPLHCPLPCATPPLQSLLMIRLFSR